MIIIKIKGGLGNQMFQYAFGRALSSKIGTETKFDIQNETTLSGIKKDIDRPFLLDQFNIKATIASKDEIYKIRKPFWLYISKLWRKFMKHNYNKFDPKFLNKMDNTYFEGFWWQSELYFKNIRDILLKEFTLRNEFSVEAKRIAQDIDYNKYSVSVHIRRGDYVSDSTTHAHHGFLGGEYYKEAINLMNKKTIRPSFYVFSDDIEWVRTNIIFPSPTIFISDENISTPEELILMSLCRHHIIANSTFSWWGAWLGSNEDKIVIAPKNWLSDYTAEYSDIYPCSWIKI